MYYVDYDGGIVPTTLKELPDYVVASRMFATVAGAACHPDAVPVTPISLKTEAMYDGKQIIENEIIENEIPLSAEYGSVPFCVRGTVRCVTSLPKAYSPF